MNKLYILMLLVAGLLVGCSAESKTITSSYELPPELSHCKVFFLDDGSISGYMRVLYCPHAITTTTHMVGKTTANNTVVALDTATIVPVDTMGMGEYQRLQQKFDTTGYGEYQRLQEKFGK